MDKERVQICKNLCLMDITDKIIRCNHARPNCELQQDLDKEELHIDFKNMAADTPQQNVTCKNKCMTLYGKVRPTLNSTKMQKILLYFLNVAVKKIRCTKKYCQILFPFVSIVKGL